VVERPSVSNMVSGCFCHMDLRSNDEYMLIPAVLDADNCCVQQFF
jgi:hypothetical protein